MTIDERIVKLGLNNNNFEKHAEESLRTLDKLDKSLNSFGEAVCFDKLGGLIDTVTHRFSALGIAGDQVIRNLTNQVMSLVGQMGNLAKSMSIDQIGEGFSKYGEKTGAVQTIMAATAKDWDDQGAQMEYVNEQLEKLNWFTDETSYSFLDMVNNIGKFTSNGFGLEESVTAMEGISTWAAISGANVAEAGRAMYNLSQAMATGSVKLMDWKSIENANMATREFKETALEIAVEMGTLKKNADGSFTVIKNQAEEADKALTGTKKKAEAVAKTFTTEQFNTELSTGWFSKDVLMKTLQQYGRFTDVLNQASEATGMTASQIIHEIDAYKKGASVVSELTPYIKELASAENDLGFRSFKAAQEAKTFTDAVQATKDAVSTGWMNLWEKVFGNYLDAKQLWTDVAESFYNIFAEPVNKLNEIFDIAFGGKTKAKETSKRVDVLESKLGEVGKTTKDLEKAFSKIDDIRLEALVSQYGSLEEAINRGAISAELLKKVLGELNIGEEVADEVIQAETSVTSFSDRLSKIGRSMEDLEHAVLAVSDRATLDMIEDYGGVEEALKKGAISADLFREALQYMAGESSDSAEAVGEDLSKLSGHLEDYRKVALEVLRGDWDNGEARRKALEEAGYDYEMIQWLAGNLQAYGYEVSDDFLLSLDKTENVRKAFEQLAINAGYTTEEIAAMNEMLENSDAILGDIKIEAKQIDRSAEKLDLVEGGKLFRESIMNILHSIEGVADAISQAFDLVFGGSEDADEAIRSFGARLNDLIKRFHDFTSGLVMTDEQIEKLRDRIAGIFRLIKTGGSVIGSGVKTVIRLAKSVLDVVVPVIGTILESITSLYDRLNRNGTFINFANGLKNIFDGLSAAGKVVYDNITGIFKYFRTVSGAKEFSFLKIIGDRISILGVRFEYATYKFKKFLSSAEGEKKINDVFNKIFHALKSIKDAFSEAKEKAAEFKDSLTGIGDGESFFSKIAGVVKKVVDWISNAFGTLKTSIQNAFGKDGGVGLTAVLSNLLKALLGFTAIKGLGKIFSGIGKAIGGIGSIGEFLQNPASIFSNFFDGLKEMLGFNKEEGSFVKDLKTIAISIGILAASLALLASIPEDKIAGAMGHLTTLLVEMIGAIKTLDFIKPGKEVSKAATALLMIAGAMLVLSLSLKILSKIDPDSMKMAWEAMSLSLLSMVAALTLIDQMKLSGKRMLAAGAAIMGIATAMLVLTASLAILSFIPGDKLTKAWEAMSLSLLSMVAALYLLKGVGAGSMLAAGAAMVGIAAAMLILSVSLAVLSKVIQGNDDIMMAFIITITVMAVALALLAGIGPLVLAAGAALMLAGIGFAAGAVAMLLLAGALRIMQGLPLGELAGGLALIGLALIPLGLGGVALGLGAIGLGLGAVAMIPLAIALRIMSGLDLPKIAGGLALVGLALIPIGLGGIALGAGALGLFLGAPALAALGEALIPLSNGLNAMQSVSIEALVKTFVALAEGIAALFALQFATIINGVPVLKELGTAMPELADGFKSFETLNGEAIALAGAGLGKAIGALFKLQFSSFRDGSEALRNLASIIPELSNGFAAFSTIDGESLETTGTALSNAIKSLFKLQFSTIKDGTPQLMALGSALPVIANGFNSFKDIDAGWLDSMSKSLDSALSTLTNGGIFSKKRDYSSLVDLGSALTALWIGMSNFIGVDVMAPATSISTVLSEMQNTIIQSLPAFELNGSEVSASFAVGLRKGLTYVTEAFASIPNQLNNIMQAYYTVWEILGGNVSIGLANGIYKESGQVVRAANELASAVQKTVRNVLDVHSPSRVMAEIGGYVSIGLGEGIRSESDYIEESMIVAISPALAAMNALADSDFSITPTITPVVDLSNVNSAASSVNNVFGKANLGTFNRATAVQAERYSTYAPNTSRDTGVINELQSLSARMDTLGEKITNMQIVLDTGVLVGATSAKMDHQLGVMAGRKARGN